MARGAAWRYTAAHGVITVIYGSDLHDVKWCFEILKKISTVPHSGSRCYVILYECIWRFMVLHDAKVCGLVRYGAACYTVMLLGTT